MQVRDPEVLARHERVRDLCRQLARLLTQSRDQRESIDRLLGELQRVTGQTGAEPALKAATAGAGARGGRAKAERA